MADSRGLDQECIPTRNRFSILAGLEPLVDSEQAPRKPSVTRRKWTPAARRAHKRDLKARKIERAAAQAAAVGHAPDQELCHVGTMQAEGTLDIGLESNTNDGETHEMHSTEMHVGTLCSWHAVQGEMRGAPAQFMDNQDWMLDKVLFNKVVRLANREFEIDLFANKDGLNAFCSEFCFAEGRSVYDEDYRGRCIYANPAFNQLFLFLVHYLITKLQDANTSGVFVLPQWQKKPWWPLVQHFRTLCRWKKGSNIFSAAPLQPGGARRLVGPTRWPVVVVSDEPGAKSAQMAFRLLKALCYDTVDGSLQYECEDARARVVCAAQQKFVMLKHCFDESQKLSARTIYQFCNKLVAPVVQGSMQEEQQMITAQHGQQVTVVHPGLGEPGGVSDTVASPKGVRGKLGGWLLRAKSKANEFLHGATASRGPECTPGQLMKVRVCVKGCRGLVDVVALPDSGATNSAISSRLVKQLGLVPIQLVTPVSIELADKSVFTVSQCLPSLQFRIAGVRCRCPVYVVPELPDELLLGTNFMHAYDVDLNFEEKCIYVRGVQVLPVEEHEAKSRPDCVVSRKQMRRFVRKNLPVCKVMLREKDKQQVDDVRAFMPAVMDLLAQYQEVFEELNGLPPDR